MNAFNIGLWMMRGAFIVGVTIATISLTNSHSSVSALSNAVAEQQTTLHNLKDRLKLP